MSLAASAENSVTIVGIRFRPAGRIYHFDPQGVSYTTGQYVIVETVRGVEAGRVVIASKKMAESDLSDPLKPVVRLATEDELRMMLSFKSKEKEALVQCAYHVGQHKLPMKLVEAEYTFDGSRLTFYFTADERVDFRALVRDLAATFRTRIELRQIGARDQAKLQSGVGPCGKTLCCSSWISDFGVVSIKMAKEQDLPLNPAKISGVCGRLLCCLSYENDNYIQARQRMPQVGTFLNTPSGPGKVVSVNVPRSSVEVMLESGAIIPVPIAEDEPVIGCNTCTSRGSCCGSASSDSKASTGCATCGSGGACTCGSGGAGGGGCGGGCKTRKKTTPQAEKAVD
ncbi:MAG TPA: stage 0 sporulation family protein [Ktedonobacteraceae bacterium]|nr:stage 0 sporulation family protein [Ktedonobacteraceae bacterium]